MIVSNKRNVEYLIYVNILKGFNRSKAWWKFFIQYLHIS